MYGSFLRAGWVPEKFQKPAQEMPQNTQGKKMQKSLPMPNVRVDIYLFFMSLGIHEKVWTYSTEEK